ncbi:MAG: hypothetical protein EON58_02090 [Alphaproteobacteria bacterium]|nr:MAG: hypothetical protein EON58_02090 [Alphaproteobacteria bacterium]
MDNGSATESLWWKNWWSEDYSWAGLNSKFLAGWAFNSSNGSFAAEDRVAGKPGFRDATLQDFWRFLDGDLVRSPDGQQEFTSIHLPLFWPDGSPTPKNPEHTDFELFNERLIHSVQTAWTHWLAIADRYKQRGGGLHPPDLGIPLSGAVLLDFPYAEADLDVYNVKAERAYFGGTFVGCPKFGHAIFRAALFAHGFHSDATRFMHQADFAEASFPLGAGFDNCTFDKGADFTGANFCEGANFKGARFTKVASFNDVRFEGASFEGALFESVAIFDGATFEDVVHFKRCCFLREASFIESRFAAQAHFDDVKFRGDATFLKTHFMDWARFLNAEFEHSTTFQNAIFDLAPRFQQAKLHEDTTFDSAKFRSVDRALRNAQWKFWVLFAAAFAAGLGALWIDGLPGWVLTFCFVALLVAALAYALLGGARATESDDEMRAFRALTLHCEKFRNRRDAARFYRLELKATRLRTSTHPVERFISFLYDLSSQYGNSMTRPLVALVFVVLAFSAIYWVWEAHASSRMLATTSYQPAPHAVDAGLRLIESTRYSLSRAVPFFPFSQQNETSCDFADRLTGEGDLRGLCGFQTVSKNDLAWRRLAVGLVSAVQSLLAVTLAFLFGLAVRRRFQID